MENQEQNNQQTTQPQKTYNPFIANVNEKPYSQMNVETDPSKLATPIPEPTFQGNTVKSGEDAYSMLNGDFGIGAGSNAPNGGKAQSAPFNPAMNNVPDADRQMGAEHLAKMMIDGYEQLHVFANKALQIPERKLRKMVAEGEIDLSVPIPYAYGQTITAGEFIMDFNEQNKDTLTVTKEFKKEVTPVLKRVLEKRGAGLTDEQMLMYMFGKDIAVKGVIVSQIRGTMKDMLEIIKEHTVALRENGHMATGTPVSPRQEPPKPNKGKSDNGDDTPPAPVTPRPTRSVVVKEDDAENMVFNESFNFDTNEVVVESRVLQKHNVPESGKARLMQQKKRDAEIKAAMSRAEGSGVHSNRPSYKDALAKRKSGKRGGKKPSDYIAQVDEAEIAEAIVLNESKPVDKDKIAGLE